jgi:hypothetical protein
MLPSLRNWTLRASPSCDKNFFDFFGVTKLANAWFAEFFSSEQELPGWGEVQL